MENRECALCTHIQKDKNLLCPNCCTLAVRDGLVIYPSGFCKEEKRMGAWKEIRTYDDIQFLMKTYNGFHDSCIKELKYVSGAYVGDDGSMFPFNNQRSVRIIFHRQNKNPAAIEMEFSKVMTLCLSPKNEEYTAEIFEASMWIDENKIYWYDSFLKEKPSVYRGTWIEAESVRWRAMDDCMGDKEIYVMKA